MWFKCGVDLLNCAMIRELNKPSFQRDNKGEVRILKLIMLLSETAEDRADDIQDAEDLARLVDTTQKQAQIVWDVCIKHNVLRRGPKGYSAKEWMIERGILGDTNKWRRNEEPGGGYQQARQESKNVFY